MGKNGQISITDVAYRPELGAPIGMDVLDFGELLVRGRRRGIDLAAPQRPAFHHLLHVRSGSLRHSVDFTDHELTAGGWLWISPGQVHHYAPDDLTRARGTIVIWQPGFVPAEPPYDRTPLLPTGHHARAVQLALRHLTREYADLASVPLDTHIGILRHLLTVLLLRLAHARPVPVPPALTDDTFRRYHAAVERGFASSHRVTDYADALGFSVRTLTRATLAAAGSTAKQYLDARILLEAKRLLLHTDATAAAVGAQLGFADPGDFTKFFRKRADRSPLQFRAMARGTSGTAASE